MKNLEFPVFGSDHFTVAGYTTDQYPQVYRLFIPIQTPDGGSISWKKAAGILDVEYSSRIRWSSLEAAGEVRKAPIGVPPVGEVPVGFFEQLIKVTCEKFDSSKLFTFVLWHGYADKYIDDVGEEIPASGQNYLSDGNYKSLEESITWLRLQDQDLDARAPVAFWSSTEAIVLAGPAYLDSYYVSCNAALAAEVQSRGYEMLPIDRSSLLPR